MDILKKAGQEPAEDSVPLRVAVGVCVLISIFSLAKEGVITPSFALGSSILIVAGYVYSFMRRRSSGIFLKSIIFVLLLLALADFLRKAYQDPYETRIPLAELFIWVQTLHGFHLPRRKDLLYSLVSSLVLISLAGSYATGMDFLVLIIPWFASCLVALYLSQLSRFNQLCGLSSPQATSVTRPIPFKTFSLLTIAILVLGFLLGSLYPRLPHGLLRPLPFSLVRPFHPSQGFRWSNPGFADLPMKPPVSPLEFSPDGYFGFAPYLDLRLRVRPNKALVMKVRSSAPAYWRGVAFREYHHSYWSCDEEERPISTDQQPFWISWDPREAHTWTDRLVQTFYLEAEEANVIFGAYRPSLLYFPSETIFVSSSGLKSPYPLSDGVVYSVVSEVIRNPFGGASHIGDSSPASQPLRPYLQLPELPERVVRLAKSLAAGSGSDYETALKIQDFLERGYRYSFDIPPLEEGEDAVDRFLFEDRAGFCEQFASAFTVLCRLAGIPARVVTGYATGEYNPFTGLYEVHKSDAHAWAEIYVESCGWVTMDPTPGKAPPEPRGLTGPRMIIRELLSWFKGKVSASIPVPLRKVLVALPCLLKEFPYNLVFFTIGAFLALFLFIRKKAIGLLMSSGLWGRQHDALARPVAVFLVAMSLLGLTRRPWQTFREYLLGLPPPISPSLSMEAASLYEGFRYGDLPRGSDGRLRLRLLLWSIFLKSARGKVSRTFKRLFAAILPKEPRRTRP